MPQAKQTSKRKHRSKALPVLGAAGLSLSLASGASAVPSGLADTSTSKTGDDNRVTLGEEEISDTAWRRSTSSTRKAKAQESLSVKRRFRTSAWRRSRSSTRKAKIPLSQA